MPPAPALPGLADRLVDDAAAFPPANAPVAAAVEAHRRLVAGPAGPIVGPLLVPAAQVETLRLLAGPDDDLEVGIVAGAGEAGVAAAARARQALADDPWIRVTQVEVRVAVEDDLAAATGAVLAALPFTVPTYLELPAGPDLAAGLEAVAADGAERVKLRCGGTRPGDVPSAFALAAFLHGAVTRRLAFKLTAGLHHAVPTYDPGTGDTQHGFLNALAATRAALDGADAATVAEVLHERRPAPLLELLASGPTAPVRRALVSIGSCSVLEPYHELRRLGLVENA